jgi:hypothetical protein
MVNSLLPRLERNGKKMGMLVFIPTFDELQREIILCEKHIAQLKTYSDWDTNEDSILCLETLNWRINRAKRIMARLIKNHTNNNQTQPTNNDMFETGTGRDT